MARTLLVKNMPEGAYRLLKTLAFEREAQHAAILDDVITTYVRERPDICPNGHRQPEASGVCHVCGEPTKHAPIQVRESL